MKIIVIYSTWAGDGFDEPLAGGEHDLGDLTEEQARSVAGAIAAGALRAVDADTSEVRTIHQHVQSQEDGEAAYSAAQESGRWQHGNLLDLVARKTNRLAEDDALRAGDPAAEGFAPLTDEQRAAAELQIAQAEAALETVEVPT